MISGTLAVQVLRAVNAGEYKEKQHWNTQRDFHMAYKPNTNTYISNSLLDNKILVPYVPHKWINN
jgi:hypothetical protein